MNIDLPASQDETVDVPPPVKNNESKIEKASKGFKLPEYISHYKITGFLGKGGMGLVYRGIRSVQPQKQSQRVPKINISLEEAIREVSREKNLVIDEETINLIEQKLAVKLNGEAMPGITKTDNGAPVSALKEQYLPKPNQEVAIKTMNKVINPSNVSRFVDEFNDLQRLNRKKHPNIVQVYELGEDNDTLFYSMEILQESIPEGLTNEMNERLKIVKQVCNGLKLIHSAGFVHRDIKPSNLRIRKAMFDLEDIVITDFGIGKSVTKETLTATGTVMGTAEFMAPEQARESKKVTDKADIYPLGVYLFESLTGEKPDYGFGQIQQGMDNNALTAYLAYVGDINNFKFLVKTPNEARRSLNLDPIPEKLEAIIIKALSKLPENRYYAEELIQDINNFLKGDPVEAMNFYNKYINERYHHFHKDEILAKKHKKQKIIASGIGAVLIAGAVTLGAMLYTGREAKIRYQNLFQQTQSAVALEQGSLADLLNAETEFARLLSETSEASVKYQKDAVAKNLTNLKQELEAKQASIDNLILLKAVEELKATDPLSNKADELQNLILTKLSEYKLKHLIQTLPEDQIPSLINIETGQWNFADLSQSSEISHYPRMLLTAYKATNDPLFWNKFVNLSLLIKKERSLISATAGFADTEYTLGELIEVKGDSELKKMFLEEADKLLLRFIGVNHSGERNGYGDYFQSSGYINDKRSSQITDCYTGYYLDILVHAFMETGEMKYWNAYNAHMKTMLDNFIKEDGSVYRSIAFAQEQGRLNDLNRDVYPGEVIAKISMFDWRDETSVLASSQPIALLGLIKYYHYTGSQQALTAAKNLAEFLLRNKEQDEFIWRAIINRPLDDSHNQKDTHASVLIANALLELSQHELALKDDENKRLAELHSETAKRIMHNLTTKYLDTSRDYQGFLLNSQIALGKPGGLSAIFTDDIYFNTLEKLAVLNKTAELFHQRNIILEGNNTVQKSGFVTELNGALTTDDRTILNIRKDENNIYLSFKCFYKEELTSYKLPNEDFNANDWLELTFDIPDDNKPMYSFMFTPSGIKRDSLGKRDVSWNPEWNLTTRIDQDHWNAEVVIPFSSLPELKERKYCKFNVYRRSDMGSSSLCYVGKYYRNMQSNERAELFKTVDAILLMK